ncbi:hypothetical protein DRO69_09035 [Candidatus Bathyarchaeota archaeon]|nr:MAG: hypothetical protein DRO69_09035 [Candidatus Bathyarchaeota archaeon]
MMYKMQFPKIVLIIIITSTLAVNEIRFYPVEAIPDIKKVPEEYPTIQAAINAASPGDTIIVTHGTYNENLLVNKSISIIGENPATTIIDGGQRGNAINVVSSGVVISGFTIQNGTGGLPYSGISVSGCNFVVINNTVLRENYYGLQLTNSNNSQIFNNVIMNNMYAGIYIHDRCSNNAFFENTIKNNIVGVWSSNSPSNVFYHNNFINNTNQLQAFPPMILDNGSEGNYWSDCIGSDIDLDGVGDAPFAGDRYPLMGMFVNFTLRYGSQIYFLSIICNSTISNFHFDRSNGKISFDVLGSKDTVGFCRMASPLTIIKNYTVYINDKVPIYIGNWTVSNYIYGYFLYLHESEPQRVTVMLDLPKNENPQSLFPILVATLLIVTALTIIILIKRKGKLDKNLS